MVLTAKQQQGLAIAVERYRNGEKYTCISGYAGSGKSTLVRHIIDALNVDPNLVCYSSYTGKATQVLLKKGNKEVLTLHKLLYDFELQSDGSYSKYPKTFIKYKIVVVDEVSMAPMELLNLLFSHDVYVLCLGDPAQLPPVCSEETNPILAHPHIFLDEIMRQAQESEIIRLTMDIRAGKPLPLFDGKDVKIYDQKDLCEGMLTWADQVLVATNKTRITLNQQMRKMQGRGPQPEEGDKVICLKNYWTKFANNKDPLVNGTIGFLKNIHPNFHWIPKWITRGKAHKLDILAANFISDSGAYFTNLEMDKELMLKGESFCTPEINYKILHAHKSLQYYPPLEFAYGYAITGWKSQGSEWDKVLVLEENFPFSKDEHQKFLYTCATRSAEKLVIIRNN